VEEAREHPAVGEALGPTLVLLPGLDGTGILFRPLIEALPPEIRTLTCTYPGDEFLPPARLAETVEARISGIGDVVILAESWSGLVCLELLRRNPNNIAGVIFVACFAAPPRPALLALSRLLPLSVLMRLPPPASLVRRYCLGAGAAPEQLALFREALAAVRPEVLAARLGSMSKIGPYAEPVAPTACYVQATTDRLVPARAEMAFSAMAPNLEIARVAGPHFLLQARPGECAVIIRDFIRRLSD
jgi:pimeloyl-ACP methyl ester carboxylesterase